MTSVYKQIEFFFFDNFLLFPHNVAMNEQSYDIK